jgi:hypothetical protein
MKPETEKALLTMGAPLPVGDERLMNQAKRLLSGRHTPADWEFRKWIMMETSKSITHLSEMHTIRYFGDQVWPLI